MISYYLEQFGVCIQSLFWEYLNEEEHEEELLGRNRLYYRKEDTSSNLMLRHLYLHSTYTAVYIIKYKYW